MHPTDGADPALQNEEPSESNSHAASSDTKISSEIETVEESESYRFAEMDECASHNGSNEDSLPPSFQSTAELYSRSLNDVSSLMNERMHKDDDSQASLPHAHECFVSLIIGDTNRKLRHRARSCTCTSRESRSLSL